MHLSRIAPLATTLVIGSLFLSGCGGSAQASISTTTTTAAVEKAASENQSSTTLKKSTTSTTANVARPQSPKKTVSCANYASVAVVNKTLGSSFTTVEETDATSTALLCSYENKSAKQVLIVGFDTAADPQDFTDGKKNFTTSSGDTFTDYSVKSISGYDDAFVATAKTVDEEHPTIVAMRKATRARLSVARSQRTN